MTDRKDLAAELDALAAAALGQPPALGPVATGGDERTVQVYLDAARSTSDVAAFPPGETRMLGLKRTIMRLSRLFLHRQAHYNTSMERAVTHLNEQVAALRARFGAEFARVGTTVAHLDMSIENMEDRVTRLDAVAVALQTKLDDTTDHDALRRDVGEIAEKWSRDLASLAEAQAAVKAAASVLRADLDRAISDIRTTTPPAVREETIDDLVASGSRRADAFYERFEDQMRGSDDAVRSMLEPYLEDLDARRHIGGRVYDIGCGRGEWLDLLRSKGIDATGIDTNEQAVASCVARGLDAVLGDALAYLRELPPDSALAITGFHIIEHVAAETQIELIQLALRALRPGGLLILETPNPTNLTVGAAGFYLDPSHLRPVNPTYLAFLYGDIGFVGVETRFLHPRDGYAPGSGGDAALADELMWAIRGPQDFAVLGRKPAATS